MTAEPLIAYSVPSPYLMPNLLIYMADNIRHLGATDTSDGLTHEGQPRNMSERPRND